MKNLPITPSSNRFFKNLSLLVMLLMLGVNGVMGQNTLPTAYSLSSGSYTLSSHTGSSFPTNMAIGFVTNSTDGNFTTDITSNATYNSTGTSGSWDDEGTNGISYQGSGSAERGSFLFRAVSTNRTSINVAWTVRDISASSNTNYIELQWRSGGSGSWNNVTGDLYQQGATASGTSFSVTLPSLAENLSDLRIRWIYYENGTGTRDRLAIDDITVSSSSSSVGPLLAVTGTTSHGSACVSSSTTAIQYTITNSGTTDATGVSVASSNSSEFTISTALSSTTIAGNGGTATYSVTFTPNSTGARTSTVTVSSGSSGSNSPTSSLTGTGTTPVSKTVSSVAATTVANDSATLNGNVTALGVCPSTSEKGFVYSATATNADPLNGGIGVTKTPVAGLATGAYTIGISSLSPGTGYTFKAYVYDGTSYTYGSTTTFTTSAGPPSLTPSVTATVDAPFDVTFTDDASWRGAVTSITVGGTQLTSGYTVSPGKITFTPSASVPVGLLQTAGANKTIVVSATGYSSDTVSQSIGAGVANKLAMNTQSTAPTTNGGVLATQPKVNIVDQYGNVTTSTASITAAVGSGTWTLGGTVTLNGVSGIATFIGLTATSASAVTGATITFTSGSLTSVTSSGFNIPAPAPTNNLCSSPTTITLNGSTLNDSTVAATYTDLIDEPFTAYSDVWYSFSPIASSSVNLSLTTTATDYDLYVFTSCPSSAVSYIIGGSAEGSSTTGETLTFNATASTSYLIRVVNTTSTAGSSFTLALTSPIITVATTTAAFTTTYGTPSTVQSFTISGAGLSANLVATAPTGFEVSADGNAYGSSATFSQSSGNATGTLRVRLKANAAVTGSYNAQNIVLSSIGATSVNITTAASGNAVTAKALTITASDRSKNYGASLTLGTSQFTSIGLANSETIGSVTLTASEAASTTASAGTYPIVLSNASGGTFTASNYSITYTNGTLTINKIAQAITFASLASKTYGDGTFDLTGTASSGLALTYISSNLNVATISGSTVTILGAGTTTITASQAGDENYNAATSVRTLAINAKGLTITGLTANNKTYDGTTLTALSGTPSLVGVINSDDVSVTGIPTTNFVSLNVGQGITVNVTGYSLSGTRSSNYSLIQPIGLTANITKADQTITLDATVSKTTADGTYSLPLNASSSLAITYSSSNLAVATVSGNTVTILGIGTSTISAAQSGNTNYNAATSLTQVLTVSKGSQVISFNAFPTLNTNASPFNLNTLASSSSGLPLTYISSNPAVASVTDNILTIVGAGSTTISASQSGNENFFPAANVNQVATITIAPVLIAGWDFQTTTNGGTAIVVAPNSPKSYTANFGSGTMFLNGTNGSSNFIADTTGNELTAFAGTTQNTITGDGFSTVTTNGALSILGGTSNSANGKSIVFKFSITELENLVITYTTQKTGSGFTSHTWAYSTDGTAWTNFDSKTWSVGTATTFTNVGVVTLANVSALNNLSTAFVRLTVNGATTSTGNNRFDNIKFEASLIQPTITSSTIAIGSVGTSFTYNIVATGQVATYSATGLPAGLSINTATGVISGTPTMAGTFNVSISASNTTGTDTKTLVITIIPTTTLATQSCGATLIAPTSFIYATPFAGSIAYEFEVTYNNQTYPTVISNDSRIRLTEVTGLPLVFGGMYSIRVRIHSNNQVGSFGTSCTLSTSSIPTTMLAAQSCGATLTAPTSFIYATPLVGVSAYEFEVSYNNETYPTVTSNDSRIRLTEVTGLPLFFGAMYSIRVRIHSNNQVGSFGTSCNVITPTIAITTLDTRSCGATLSASSSFIYATPFSGASAYEFEVTYNDQTYPTVISNDSRIRLTEVTGLPLVFGGIYSIRVRIHSNDQVGQYGSSCTVNTPSIPTTTLRPQSCGATIGSSNTFIYATPLSGASAYEFEVTYNNQTYPTVISNDSRFKLFEVTGLPIVSGGIYSIRVRIHSNNQIGLYDATCTITINNSNNTRQEDIVIKEDVKSLSNSVLSAYPNPFTTSFYITPLEGETSTMFYQVYDVTGKILESKTVEAGEIQHHAIGNYYPTGMYIVMVRQGATSQTFKMIKQ